MTAVLGHFSGFRDDESGATAIEYGLIAALIAVAVIASMVLFGSNLAGMFNMISSRAAESMGG